MKIYHMVAPFVTKQTVDRSHYWVQKTLWTDLVSEIPSVSSKRQAKSVVIVYSPPKDFLTRYGIKLGESLVPGYDACVWENNHMPEPGVQTDLDLFVSREKPVFGTPKKIEIFKWQAQGAPSQKLQTLLYRIPEKTRRTEIRKLVLEYIAGGLSETDLITANLPSYITKFVESPEVIAVKLNIQTGVESFETRYVLNSLGK
jgi:hypothetical protein